MTIALTWVVKCHHHNCLKFIIGDNLEDAIQKARKNAWTAEYREVPYGLEPRYGEVIRSDYASCPEHKTQTISVEAYCTAFETWTRVNKESSGGLPAEQIEAVFRGTHFLRSMAYPDTSTVVPIDLLCDLMTKWTFQHNHVPFVAKSNLLARLIYGGEKLRLRKCPIHKGRWSGAHQEPCPSGCNDGYDATGWLPFREHVPEAVTLVNKCDRLNTCRVCKREIDASECTGQPHYTQLD